MAKVAVDLLVIGAGVVGLAAAHAWLRRHPGSRVVVLDKESSLGCHASGRNSGVLHAGFYYSADSLKARFCREGNQRMREFCDEEGIDVRACGKLVVSRTDADHAALDDLLERGRRNGVPLESVTEEEARSIEPLARTAGRALWSASTASVDPVAVLDALRRSVERLGGELRMGEAALARDGDGVRTPHATYAANRVLNAAGLCADRVARWWGAGAGMRILPFKGFYAVADDSVRLRVHVYPVPDLDLPFLGVHFTVTVDGHVKVGPTAIPAFSREHYSGFSGLTAVDLCESARGTAELLATNPGFRRLTVREAPKLWRRELVRRATPLVHGVDPSAFRRWGPPGIRAQLYDERKRVLVMDFVAEPAERSLHVLNAVSPGFTCAFPFGDHLVDGLTSG